MSFAFLLLIQFLQDYDVLDTFFTPLENEDFKALWEAIGWPLIITKQVNTRIFLVLLDFYVQLFSSSVSYSPLLCNPLSCSN